MQHYLGIACSNPFLNRRLRGIMKIYCPEVVSNKDLWPAAKELVNMQMKKRNRHQWKVHNDHYAVEKALSWNSQVQRR